MSKEKRTTLSSFTSQSGLHQIRLETGYIHGTQTWFLTAEKPDGSKTEKPYFDPRTAKEDYEKLRRKLEKYESPEIVA
jgi:hypothetical protein